MSETDLQREKRLFMRLLDFEHAIDRNAFLDRECEGEPDLRKRLEDLLALQEPAQTLLEPLSEQGNDPDTLADKRLEEAVVHIGRYRLLRRIGSGGCGVVYLAEQEEPVRRRVALKIIRLGMHTHSVISRFELERQALAIMDHPNIARVLDGGTTDSGRPYFVMELVDGVKITEYCLRHRLPTSERLRLFAHVCHALQHAHQKGIIHRDIKPSNILVTAQDGRAVPKVIDFGIAKAIEGRESKPAAELTRQFNLVGTPAYMSPEQTDVGNPDLDTRSDIYSLGVLLYELLTGRTPFSSRELEAAGWEEMRRIIREREAPKPSAAIASLPMAEQRALAYQHQTEPARLVAAVKGDLDCIVSTALEKDRGRRYETAFGLAMDIRRHLANELVAARPPSRVYRLGKLVRRNQLVFLVGALAVASLAAGLGASTWLLLRERAALREQARLLEQAEAREKIARAAVLLSYGRIQQADSLVGSVPDDLFPNSLECAQVLRTLGEWHAVARRWDPSARYHFALARVITRVDDSDSEKVSFSLIPVGSALREQGDLARYDVFRREAVERFSKTTDPQPAEQVLKASLLAPCDPVFLAELEPLVEVVKAALARSTPETTTDAYLDGWRCFVAALYELRRGAPESALEWSRKSLRYDNPNQARISSVCMIKAMAYNALGETEEARKWIDTGRPSIDDYFRTNGLANNASEHGFWVFWFDWINARVLMREAIGRLPAKPVTE